MRYRVGYWLLVVFVLADLAYSTVQNYQVPLDGDLGGIVLPSPSYAQVLQDPFGWSVLTENAHYAATNRHFAHALLSGYFRHVPLWLQSFLSPINSVYAASALFKTLTQLLCLGVLVGYIRLVAPNRRWQSYWLAAALVVPLFQGAGFNAQMGIIDHSVTYTCFYAFPLALLLLWFLPYCRALLTGATNQFTAVRTLGLAGLAVVLALNGPVTPAAFLVAGGMLLGYIGYCRMSKQPLSASVGRLNGWGVALLVWFAALCVYSLYLGGNNTENPLEGPDIWARYQLLPIGIFKQLTDKLGLPLLVGFCLLNHYLLGRFLPHSPAAWRLRRLVQWVGWFALGYLLLLPFGGYRSYRPYLIRRDTALPIILALSAFYGMSSYYLLHHLPKPSRLRYLGAVVVFGSIFMFADKLRMANNNACERQALQQLASSTEPVLHLPITCTVMAWQPLAEPGISIPNAQLFHHWRITRQVVLYDQH